MRPTVIFCLFFLAVNLAGFSQTTRAKHDSARSTYIEGFPDQFAVWPHVKYRDLSFRIRDQKRDQPAIHYNPNNNLKAGAGFYLLNLSFEISFAVPVPLRDESVFGKSKALDLQANILSKSLGVDLYLQNYTGFYKETMGTKIPSGEPYPFRPDMEVKNLGGSVFYVWNKNKFSMRSAYNYADRQKRSAGSFILYGTLNSFTVSADSAVISPSMQSTYGEGFDFNKLRYFTASAAPGYSYNLVIKRFFVNGMLAFGPAYNWVRFVPANGESQFARAFHTAYTARVAAGYNGSRFFTGASFGWQSRALGYKDMRFENSTSVFRFAVGYRFTEKGFLKRHFWDILRKHS